MPQHSQSPAARTIQVARIIKARRSAVYAACLDPDAVARWRVPDNMTARVGIFDAREGGVYRMSLTYLDPRHSPGGKSSESTDTFQGRFAELVPNEKIVEIVEFESPDPGLAGEMTMTTSFTDVDEGTEITMRFENIPSGIRLEDNETGSKQALEKLAALLE